MFALRLHLKFGLCRISVYSGFGLDRFHCICRIEHVLIILVLKRFGLDMVRRIYKSIISLINSLCI